MWGGDLRQGRGNRTGGCRICTTQRASPWLWREQGVKEPLGMIADKVVIPSVKAPLWLHGGEGKINRSLGGHHLSLWGLRKENFVAKATSKKGANESKNSCACPLLSTITLTAGWHSRTKHQVLEEWSSRFLHASDNNSWRFCCYFVLGAIKTIRDKESVCIFLSRFWF